QTGTSLAASSRYAKRSNEPPAFNRLSPIPLTVVGGRLRSSLRRTTPTPPPRIPPTAVGGRLRSSLRRTTPLSAPANPPNGSWGKIKIQPTEDDAHSTSGRRRLRTCRSLRAAGDSDSG